MYYGADTMIEQNASVLTPYTYYQDNFNRIFGSLVASQNDDKPESKTDDDFR